MEFPRAVLLTMIGLILLVVAERVFGMMAAMVATGIGFLGYVLWLTARQMAEEDDDDDES